jgi:UDP-N-acetylglucosamine/UDP-N-acetylgalactosamine diphosphorylase
LILQDKSTLATAPDGNGGIYTAMLGEGVLKAMKKRGVKYIHAFSIDNALVQVADPIYVGYCIENKADVGNKCCPKAT